MKFWTDTEANQFLTAARGNRLYALFYLAIVTGARQMELLGLQWPDLDWINGTLHFRRQLSKVFTYQDTGRESDHKTRGRDNGSIEGPLRAAATGKGTSRQPLG